MPMSERYYTVDGQMVGYEEGGVRKDFLTDHLGSIIAIMDENEVRVFDTRYSAYGRNRWITGTSCGFGWVGSYGYRETGLFHMSHYVRARHYSYVTGAWSTVDPLWPSESAYGYVGGRSTWSIDPSGTECHNEAISSAGWATGKHGKPASRGAKFRKCQWWLEFRNQGRADAGHSLVCPGGKRQICVECALASGLPIDCGGFPSCPPPTKNNPHPELGIPIVIGYSIFPFGSGMNAATKRCLSACLFQATLSGDNGGKAINALCASLCFALSNGRNGCDNLFNYCQRFEKEKFRKDLCMSFWLASCFGNP